MRKVKRSTEAAVAELSERISRAVSLQQQVDALNVELKGEKAAIKEVMEDAGLERQATATGEEALLVSEERLVWNVEKLADVLNDDEFETLCPRKAAGEPLRALLGADEERAKELRKCARASKSLRLELRSA
jgi:hypothetical protein